MNEAEPNPNPNPDPNPNPNPNPSPNQVFGELVAGFDTMWAINKLTTKGTDRVVGSATVTEAGCLTNCQPRPEVTAKCKTKATEKSTVQGRSIFACLD